MATPELTPDEDRQFWWAVARLLLAVAQIAGATASLIFLINTGTSKMTIVSVIATGLVTLLSRILSRVRESRRADKTSDAVATSRHFLGLRLRYWRQCLQGSVGTPGRGVIGNADEYLRRDGQIVDARCPGNHQRQRDDADVDPAFHAGILSRERCAGAAIVDEGRAR